MPTPLDEATQSILAKLLEENGLTEETRVFREAERGSLVSTGTSGRYQLAANAHPSESVIDLYGGPGYVVQAEAVGPGLAFAETPARNWQETMEMRTLRASEAARQSGSAEHVEVEVTVGDILRQGGLVYPVESVEVERVWYFTLPNGSVEVREVG